MRDRLIELIKEAKKQTKNANSDIERNMIFADHLLANGVIVPLVEIGQTIYTKYGFSFKVEKIDILKDGNKIYRCGNDGTDDYMAFYEKEIGEDIFLSREDAERALKEVKRNDK